MTISPFRLLNVGQWSIISLLCCLVAVHGETVGYVIYREKAFHPEGRARLVEIQSIKQFPALTKVVTSSGTPLEILGGQRAEFIPLPAYDPNALKPALEKIQQAETRYPQHRLKLKEAVKVWEDYSKRVQATQAIATPTPIQKEKFSFTTSDGTVFSGVEIVKQEPDGITVMTDSGITKIAFEQLPSDVQAQYKFNPEEAAKFRQKVADDREKLATAKRRAESEHAKSSAVSDKSDPFSQVFGVCLEKAILENFGAPDRKTAPSEYAQQYIKLSGQHVDTEWTWYHKSLPMDLQELGIESISLVKEAKSSIGGFWVFIGSISNSEDEKRLLHLIGGGSDWIKKPQKNTTLYENRSLRLFASIRSIDFQGARFTEVFVMDLDLIRIALDRLAGKSSSDID